MLNKVYSCFFVPYFLLSAPIFVLMSAVIFVFAYPFDPKRKLQHKFSAFMSWTYLKVSPFAKLDVSGRENVDRNQNYVIIANHQSNLDIMLLYIVPLYFRWVSKREVYRMPLVGQLLLLHGDVCIRRGDASSTRRMLRDCSAILRRRISIIMFPEGTRSKSGCVGRFKAGAFALAKANKVPILPVAIEGTHTFTEGRWLNARQRFQVHIFPPISAEEVAATDEKSLTEKVHNLVLAEHQRMMPARYNA